MGCFDYGCAVTGVSVSDGDPVLHVVVKDPSVHGPYELMHEVAWMRRQSQAPSDRKMLIRFGTYNDYGWITEDPAGDIHPLLVPNFMVKREVAEEIARRAGNVDLADPVAVLGAVCEFMFLCRINPFAVLGGVQHFNRQEYGAHTLRVQLIRDALDRKEWLQDGENDEDDE